MDAILIALASLFIGLFTGYAIGRNDSERADKKPKRRKSSPAKKTR